MLNKIVFEYQLQHPIKKYTNITNVIKDSRSVRPYPPEVHQSPWCTTKIKCDTAINIRSMQYVLYIPLCATSPHFSKVFSKHVNMVIYIYDLCAPLRTELRTICISRHAVFTP